MSEPLFFSAIGACATVIEHLGNLGGVAHLFSSTSKKEAQELVAALDEVYKTVDTVLGEVSSFRGLGVRDEQRAGPVLAEMEGPRAELRVEHKSGSCRVIYNIYDQHLGSWLKQMLNEAEFMTTASVFHDLCNADTGVFNAMLSACAVLRTEARDANDLVRENKWTAAWDRMQKNRSALLALETALEETMKKLNELRNRIIQNAGLRQLQPAAK